MLLSSPSPKSSPLKPKLKSKQEFIFHDFLGSSPKIIGSTWVFAEYQFAEVTKKKGPVI